MKEYEIVAKFCNACAGSSRPQTFFEEAELENTDDFVRMKHGKDFDKFAEIEHTFVDGLPIIKDACGYLICEIQDKIETHSHTVFIADVLNGDVLNDNTPMTYAYYHNVIKGNSPKNAPTYVG